MSDFQYNDLESAPDLSDAALRNLQCNILRSTRRIACDHVFRRFKTKQAFVAWLKAAPLPSASESTDSDLVNVLFTHEGLSFLQLPEALLDQMDPAFRRGTRGRAIELLGDPRVSKWEQPHRKPWHVVELHWRTVGPAPAGLVNTSDANSDVVVELGQSFGADGKPLQQDNAPRYNHFGIADGNSNPIYTRQDYEALLQARPPEADGRWKWDSRAKLSTLLVSDPLANDRDCFGSYFVFRKYRQDVESFRHKLLTLTEALRHKGQEWWWNQYPALKELSQEALETLSNALSSQDRPIHDALSNEAGIVLTQLIFGVGPDGQRPTGRSDNNFNYAEDNEGKKCPFSAHARACNARGSRRAAQFEHKTIVARRGISHKGGSFFWCVQASVGEQFEYIQEKFANASNVNPDHYPTPGVDYLIGHGDGAQPAHSLDVRAAVTLQAAEYLFAPSLIGFQRLRALGD